MDKSFNDQELSEIMKEIEALEEEFSGEAEESFEASSVLEELAEMKEEVAIPVAKKPEPQIIPFKPVAKPQVSAGTSMSFKVQGDMNLDLVFEVGGKSVSLSVSESGLTIQMEGGINFNVPLNEKSSAKKTA